MSRLLVFMLLLLCLLAKVIVSCARREASGWGEDV
ncbi:unnamed protein product [Brassica rapa subsp. narinosa]